MKNKILITIAIVAMLTCALPAAAQGFATIQRGPLNGPCSYAPTLGMDQVNSDVSWCGDTHVWRRPTSVTSFQGTTATAITDTNFNVLTGPSIPIPAAKLNLANRSITVEFAGVYTTGAASLLNADIALCTVSGCATGTTVAPAGCVVTSTNQANVLANGQFTGKCKFIVATTGATGTIMAHATAGFNLGAATSAATSFFSDTATAASAAVDLTVAEYVHPRFKFSTSNAGNTATLNTLTISFDN